MNILQTIERESKHAVRVLLRTPAFSLIVFVTLALGIGATTAIYTVLDAIALRPLAYRQPEQLVSVLHNTTVPGTGEAKWGLSSAGFFYFRAHNRSFSELGAYTTSTTIVADGSAPAPELLRVAYITAPLFTALRARAELGRLIDSTDDMPNAGNVVVLSDEYWRRHFGADRNVVGQVLQTGGVSRQIIGVAEPGLSLPKPGPFASTADLASFSVDLWWPLQLNPNGPFGNSHQYSGIARLKSGVTPTQAQADLARLMRDFTVQFPRAYSADFFQKYNFRVGVTALRDEMLGPTLSRTLWVLFAAVGVVLLIACANVANLFLVRMESRRRETAIRTALGADRAHMAALFLSESLILSWSAGSAGILLARVGLGALLAVAPSSVPRLATVAIDGRSALFALALATVAGLLFGLIPVARTKVDVATLREGGRGMTASRMQRSARNALIVGQMALALVLLTAAGLMFRSFAKLRDVKPGLEPHGVLTFETILSRADFDSMSKVVAFQRQFQERVAALPGVRGVGAATGLPLQDFGGGCTAVMIEGGAVDVSKMPCVATPAAAPGFFESLGIQVRGRTPTWSDLNVEPRQPTVAVVSQALATRLWPNEDPIGKGIGIGGPQFYRVVGVIPEIRAQGLDQPPTEIVFTAGSGSGMVFTVKTSNPDPSDILPAIRRVLVEMNPRVPIVNVRTMQDVVDRSMSRASFAMQLLAIAGSMALLLSAVGIYGVISYLVAQRRAEIGVRMALGARVPQVAVLVLSQSMRLAFAGIGIGLVAALVGTRLLRALLFEVSPTDPVVLGATVVTLVLIALIASAAPARSAAQVDPVEAMRA
ncbi:MAG TPA: ABC transporter permease [Gemmatimonadaceae bacterium]|jgi:predicted permease